MKRAKLVITAALLLIVCVSVAASWHDRCETETVATGSFTVTGATPTPTPLTTRTPHPTNTSIAEPESESQLTINIIGKTTEWLQNNDGMVLENVITTSRDQRITISIRLGTTILAPNATPLDHIFTGVVDPFTKSPPSELPKESYFVDIYEFTPEGTQFSNPVNIQLSYEETDIPGGIDKTTLKVFQFNQDTETWTFIPSVSNPDANTVTFSTSHFSIYALIASPLFNSTNTPTPHASPTLTPTATTNCDRGTWIIIILIIECLILNTILLVHWRNQKRSQRRYN
jgi:hypothetical protein